MFAVSCSMTVDQDHLQEESGSLHPPISQLKTEYHYPKYRRLRPSISKAEESQFFQPLLMQDVLQNTNHLSGHFLRRCLSRMRATTGHSMPKVDTQVLKRITSLDPLAIPLLIQPSTWLFS